MAENEWEQREDLSGQRYMLFNNKTKRWYLYDANGNLLTSNKNKEKLRKFWGQ